MHGRSRMAVDPRISTMPGRSTSVFLAGGGILISRMAVYVDACYSYDMVYAGVFFRQFLFGLTGDSQLKKYPISSTSFFCFTTRIEHLLRGTTVNRT